MPKRKHKHAAKRKLHQFAHQPALAAAPDQRQQGLRAFQAGRFNVAIATWTEPARTDARVAAALAEAHFRRALTRSLGADRLTDLRRAVELAPDDLRYVYHLGLAQHLAGDLATAGQCYRTVLQRDAGWPGAGMVLALAALEQDAQVDLATLPGSTPQIRAALAPVQELLRGGTPAPPTADGPLQRLGRAIGLPVGEAPLDRLWHGLGLLQAGDPAAGAALDDSRALPSAAATAVRRYYQGVAAALAGDLDTAVARWQHLDEPLAHRTWRLTNLAAVAFTRLRQAHAAGDLAQAVATAEQVVGQIGGNAALGEAVVQTFDQAAQAAAAGGNWARAAGLWEAARQVVSAGAGLGSPRPLLQNLALAYEAQEQWSAAAETWRAMLRTRPRRSSRTAGAGADGADEAGLSEAQWAWVRARVLECYKRAGAPGDAVVMFRQAIKADPDDVDLRLQLVDALLANDQEQAAYNEVQRILQIDADHVDARLRLAAMQSARGYWPNAEQTMRDLVAQHPEREDARRQLARMLLMHGEQYLNYGNRAAAAAAFEEGQRHAPDDYHFPLNLARLAIEQRQVKRAGEHIERVLTLGADQPEAYVLAIECWAEANKIDEARAVLARAEAALTPSPAFYVQLGVNLLTHAAPASPLGPFAPAPAPKATATAWSQMATEALARAVALRPDDGHLHSQIAGGLTMVRPDLALPYAETAVRLLPEDARALVTLGLLQGLNGRGREGKETLRRATRLARQQGDAETAQHSEELRRVIDSPMLGLMLQMAPMLEQLDLDDDPFYW